MKKHLRRAHRTLKKYFIPHKGNNYHPHALHTKHAFLYAVLFTILKVMLIVVAVLIPAEAFVAPDVLADQGAKIIARTNEIRVEQGLPPLTRAHLLVRSAQNRAADMGAQQYFSHVSPDGHRLGYFLSSVGYPYAEAGENLAMGFADADGAINGWMKSPTHYANLVDPTFKEFGVGIEGGVYQGKPTVFVAQHFGLPIQKVEKPVEAPTPVVPAPVAPTAPQIRNLHPAPQNASGSMQIATHVNPKPTIAQVVPKPAPVPKSILQTPSRLPTQIAVVTSKPAVVVAEPVVPEPVPESVVTATAPPTPYRYYPDHSFVRWEERGDRVFVEARAHLVGDIRAATVFVNGYSLELRSESDGSYVGSMTLPETSDELFRVVLAPTLKVTLTDGQSYAEIVEWQEPKVVSETPWQRYVQAKSWLSKSIPVFQIVQWFYMGALVLLSIALMLNIAIQVRKQHPHVIVQTLALLVILFVYIKF